MEANGGRLIQTSYRAPTLPQEFGGGSGRSGVPPFLLREHPTSNIEHPMKPSMLDTWTLDVERWMLDVD
jgi:hypothetical protein